METVELRLFEEPSLVVGGRPWPLRGLRRAFEVLALAAVHGDEPLSRESAAAQLWPDLEREDARANLRRHLSRLRELLPPSVELLQTTNREIRWNTDSRAWVDVVEFERLAADPQRAHAAMTLYRGDFLAKTCEDWILHHRERMRTTAVTISHRIATTALRNGDYAAACEYAERAIELGEWREDSLRALMTARYAMGDRLGALAAYDRFASILHRELGVRPMPETIALRESIVADVPLAQAVTPAASMLPVDANPLVGRDGELAQLRTEWDRAKRRAGTTVFIGGEAGIGKTRLTSAMAAVAADDDALVYFGHASADGSSAYQPFVDIVKSAFPLVAPTLDEAWLSALMHLVPEIEQLRPDLDARIEANVPSKELVHQAFARVIEAAAALHPVLVIFEDLHWADSDTLDALSFLARRVRGARALVLVTHRSEETPLSHPLRTVRRRLLSERRASMLALAGLDARAIRDLAERMLPREASYDDLVGETVAATAGNPLFVVQYLRDRLERGDVADSSAANVDAIIDARLQRLPADARTLISIAAVIDARFTVEELSEVSGLDEAAVTQAIDVLLDRSHVRWWSEPTFTLTFSHQLLREGALRAAPRNRQSLHARIARTLEATRANDQGTTLLVARHFEWAGQANDAFTRYLQIATPDVAPSFAIDVAHMALRVASNDRERFQALSVAASAHCLIGAPSEAFTKDLEPLRDLAEGLDDDDRFAALLVESEYHSRHGDIARLQETGEALLALAQQSGKREHLARAYEERGRCFIQIGNMREAIVQYQNAISFSQPNTVDEFRMRCFLLNCVGRLGQTERAVALFKELEAEVDSYNDARAQLAFGVAHQIMAIILETTDLFEAAGTRLLAVSERVGALATRVVALSLLAQSAYRRPDVPRARALRDEIYQFIEDHDILINSIAVRNNLTLAEREIGNIDYAIEEWERNYTMAEQIGSASAMICAVVNRAEAYVERGELLTAISLARKAKDMAKRTGEHRFEIDADIAYAEALFASGRRVEALPIMKRVIEERATSQSFRSLSNDLCIIIESLVSANKGDELGPYVNQLQELYAKGRDRITYPSRVCAALSEAAQLLGDTAAALRYRFEGKTIVSQMLEKLPDDGTRAGFAGMRFNRYLLEDSKLKATVSLNNR